MFQAAKLGEHPVKCQAEAPVLCFRAVASLFSTPPPETLPATASSGPQQAGLMGLSVSPRSCRSLKGRSQGPPALPSVGGLDPTGNTGRSGPLGFLPPKGLGMGTERETDLWRKLSLILITGQHTYTESVPPSGYEKGEPLCFSTSVLPTFGAR